MNGPMRIAALLLACSLGLPATALAAVQAWLDRNQITSGETVELTLQHDGRTDTEPDVGPLRQDFDILGRASGSSIQIVNGHMSAQMQLRLTLAPKHTGHIRVPPLTWDGEQSAALELDVGGAPAGGGNPTSPAAPGQAHVFLNSSLDQSQPYVQAGVTLTVKLYTDEPLYQASLDLPANGDVLVQQVGKDSQSSEIRNGQRYQVIERKYLLFPQRSGSIRLDGPVLDAQELDRSAGGGPFGNAPFFGGAFGNIFGSNPFAGMMNSTRPLHLRGDPIVLDVRPRPNGGSGHDWLPAQQVTLTESWQPDNVQVRAGEPVTRHLSLSAVGLTAEQLPDLSALMPLPKDMRTYPDQAKLDTEVQDGNVVGHRDQDIALIAGKAGHYFLPTLRLEWWDTIHNRQRFVELPAHTLDILPAANGERSTPAASSAITALAPNQVPEQRPFAGGGAIANLPWAWLSLALGLLWLGTLLAWWRARRAAPAKAMAPSPAGPDYAARAQDARKAFRQACRDDDAAAARRHLLAWAQAAWPEAPPAGLNALALRLDKPESTTLLRQLDRACYAGEAWHGASLLQALETMPGKGKPTGDKVMALPGLYP